MTYSFILRTRRTPPTCHMKLYRAYLTWDMKQTPNCRHTMHPSDVSELKTNLGRDRTAVMYKTVKVSCPSFNDSIVCNWFGFKSKKIPKLDLSNYKWVRKLVIRDFCILTNKPMLRLHAYIFMPWSQSRWWWESKESSEVSRVTYIIHRYKSNYNAIPGPKKYTRHDFNGTKADKRIKDTLFSQNVGHILTIIHFTSLESYSSNKRSEHSSGRRKFIHRLVTKGFEVLLNTFLLQLHMEIDSQDQLRTEL